MDLTEDEWRQRLKPEQFPTGKRYCNNGAALIFEADEKKAQEA